MSHPAAALALSAFLKQRPTVSLLVAGSVCTILPDADVVAFSLGIPYAHPLGHRGFSHSLLFALLTGTLATAFWRSFADARYPVHALCAYFTVATASNGFLDALTNGGKGVGFFIPFENSRYFLPWRPIQVSPIHASDFLERGGPVLVSEFWWVWVPALLLAITGALISRLRVQRDPSV
jgi:inner membrane protein